ncbi:hypothetical protein [Psychrosphaera algicola]|uniref:Twin-arginine translocation signal domain-containing protein n=1 Tax=Psychrosphaera algicola TaxID=3023714 RepID=A0ABT5F9V8_9GAMM|nr:hypothetical protein [Psychrosphaera sp. G1-22]MDC2888191.1 hypothetical protein [Psychrosphaera sp. G1-22]
MWKALDALSDIGILESRLAPPSGGQVASRRGFLTKVAATLAFGSVVGSGHVFAYEQSEQSSKESSAKQGNKDSAEESAKESAEKSSSGSGSGTTQEQDNKAKAAEEDAKRSQEQSIKANSEQDTKINEEISNKESAVKQPSGGNAIAVTAPSTTSIFALGLTATALLKFRQRSKSVADKEQSED